MAPRRLLVFALLLAPVLLPALPGPAEAASPAPARIVLTFDDALRAHKDAAAALEARGFRGTFFVAAGLLAEGGSFSAFLSPSDVRALAAAGHEIGSRGLSGRDLTSLPAATRRAELAAAHDRLADLAGAPIRHLSWPFAAFDPGSIADVAAFHESARAFGTTYAPAPGADLLRLPAVGIVRDTTLAAARGHVDAAVASGAVLVLAFRDIRDDPGPFDWRRDDFRALLDHIASSGAIVDTLSPGLDARPPRPTEGARGSLVLAFDDGWRGHLAASRMVQARGLAGTFYVVPEFLAAEGNRSLPTLAPSEVRTIAARHEIGSHGFHHLDLTTLPREVVRAEMLTSRAFLEGLVGRSVPSYSYPFGASNAGVVDVARGLHASARSYSIGFTLAGADPLRLATAGVVASTTVADVRGWIDAAIAADGVLILGFHDFRDAPRAFDWTHPQLLALLDAIAASGIRVRTAAQIAGAAVPPVPPLGPAVVLAFDDGLRSHASVARSLEARGVRGTFFAASGVLRAGGNFEAYLSEAELLTMSLNAHEVGSRGVRLVDLTTLGPAELDAELALGRADLERIVGKPVRHFAYPFGSTNAAVGAATVARHDTGRLYLGGYAAADLVDPAAVPAVGVVRSTTVATAAGHVDRAAAEGRAIVLVFRDIRADPGPFDWTPGDLGALLDRLRAVGVPVVTSRQLGLAP